MSGTLIRTSHDTAPPTAGELAVRAWLRSRGLSSSTLQLWHVDVSLGVDVVANGMHDDRSDTQFRLEINCEEWAFVACCGSVVIRR
jgi:hypothetical protein